jgi:hypothetical protein
MASLTELFNPTFLIFLGILVLVVALLVVYFETKFRDQNHKISSMLSLVSSLAEEVNGSKMIIHKLMNQNQQMQQNTPIFYQNEGPILEETKLNKINKINNDLIAVSDDESDSDEESEDSFDEDSDNEESDNEESDNEDSDNEDSDNEDSDNEESDDEDSVSSQDNADVKVFKLNINKNDESSDNLNDIDDLSVASLDEIDDLDDLDDSSTASIESIKEDEKANNFMDLKSINITLEETKTEQSVDYKKMALPKLRSIVAEKGLSSDSSKLKKNELLKLLGVE